jgi:hypothetical protein
VQRLTGALRRVGMAGAAGIFDHHHRNDEAQPALRDASTTRATCMATASAP